MHLPRFPTYALAPLVSAGLAAPPARAFDNDKGKKDKQDKNDDNGGMRFRGMTAIASVSSTETGTASSRVASGEGRASSSTGWTATTITS
jgi:hypothetical protein